MFLQKLKFCEVPLILLLNKNYVPDFTSYLKIYVDVMLDILLHF